MNRYAPETIDLFKRLKSQEPSANPRQTEARKAGTNDPVRKCFVVEELALSNSLTLTALVELLEEQGIVRREQVLERARVIRDGGKSDA